MLAPDHSSSPPATKNPKGSLQCTSARNRLLLILKSVLHRTLRVKISQSTAGWSTSLHRARHPADSWRMQADRGASDDRYRLAGTSPTSAQRRLEFHVSTRKGRQRGSVFTRRLLRLRRSGWSRRLLRRRYYKPRPFEGKTPQAQRLPPKVDHVFTDRQRTTTVGSRTEAFLVIVAKRGGICPSLSTAHSGKRKLVEGTHTADGLPPRSMSDHRSQRPSHRETTRSIKGDTSRAAIKMPFVSRTIGPSTLSPIRRQELRQELR